MLDWGIYCFIYRVNGPTTRQPDKFFFLYLYYFYGLTFLRTANVRAIPKAPIFRQTPKVSCEVNKALEYGYGTVFSAKKLKKK